MSPHTEASPDRPIHPPAGGVPALPRKRKMAPTKGALTRRAILGKAMDLASVQGLEGLTIGTLADALGMSKSGLFAHFGSKEELQIATVDAATEVFSREVLKVGLTAPKGLARLCAVCAAWLDYAEREVFRGGCFFSSASLEFDSRPGPVRDRVAGTLGDWQATLTRLAAEAKAMGQLSSEVDPHQLAFEFNALAAGANGAFQLHGNKVVFAQARRAIRDRLMGYAKPGSRFTPL